MLLNVPPLLLLMLGKAAIAILVPFGRIEPWVFFMFSCFRVYIFFTVRLLFALRVLLLENNPSHVVMPTLKYPQVILHS